MVNCIIILLQISRTEALQKRYKMKRLIVLCNLLLFVMPATTIGSSNDVLKSFQAIDLAIQLGGTRQHYRNLVESALTEFSVWDKTHIGKKYTSCKDIWASAFLDYYISALEEWESIMDESCFGKGFTKSEVKQRMKKLWKKATELLDKSYTICIEGREGADRMPNILLMRM